MRSVPGCVADCRWPSAGEYGHSAWIKGEATLDATLPRKSWDAEPGLRTTSIRNTLFYETPFTQTATCTFGTDQITLTLRQNVGFVLSSIRHW